jgi:hypothetical protein
MQEWADEIYKSIEFPDGPIIYSNIGNNLPNTDNSEENVPTQKDNCKEQNRLDKTKYPMTISHNEGVLTKNYLTSTTWGPENGWAGLHFIFCSDDTFEMWCSGECGDFPIGGYFEINDNQLSLYYKSEYALSDPNYTEVFRFKTSQDSLFKTDYLENVNYIQGPSLADIFWNDNSNLKEGDVRKITIKDKIIDLYITKLTLTPKADAIPRELPSKDARLLAICEDTEVFEFKPDNFGSIVGRTMNKEYYNDKLDYWYYFPIDSGSEHVYFLTGACVPSATGESEAVDSFGWVHGSNLIEKKS